MPIALMVHGGPFRGVTRKTILRRVTCMMHALSLTREELSVAITDDARIRELNRDYRHKDKATDVLAFAMREGEFGDPKGLLLGDIIVSVETARRQAKAAKRPLLDELTMLLAHGLLHLLGWDHRTAVEDRAMRKETERLCNAASPGSGILFSAKAPLKARTTAVTSTKRRNSRA